MNSSNWQVIKRGSYLLLQDEAGKSRVFGFGKEALGALLEHACGTVAQIGGDGGEKQVPVLPASARKKAIEAVKRFEAELRQGHSV